VPSKPEARKTNGKSLSLVRRLIADTLLTIVSIPSFIAKFLCPVASTMHIMAEKNAMTPAASSSECSPATLRNAAATSCNCAFRVATPAIGAGSRCH